VPKLHSRTVEVVAFLQVIQLFIKEVHSNYVNLSDFLSTMKSLKNNTNPSDDMSIVIQNKLE